MNKQVLVMLLLLNPFIGFGQIQIRYTQTYGAFSMGSMRDLQKSVLASWPVDGRIVTSFPAFWINELSLARIHQKTAIGGSLSFGSTAGRVFYSDYSGELGSDQHLFFISAMGLAGHRFLFSNDRWSLTACMQSGFMFTRFRSLEYLQINDDRIVDDIKFRSVSIALEPQLTLERSWGPISVHAKAGYHWQMLPGKLLNGSGSLTYLRIGKKEVNANWTGWRMGAGITYTFNGTKQQRDTGATGLSFGTGVGLDYGGIGVNLLAYPHRHIGFLLGGGYALAGMGYNVGIKLRTASTSQRYQFFLMGLYGYHAAISVQQLPELSRLFYGPSVGLGIDTRLSPTEQGYWTLGFNIPIRKQEVNDYVEFLEDLGVEFPNRLLPITISVGYRLPTLRR